MKPPRRDLKVEKEREREMAGGMRQRRKGWRKWTSLHYINSKVLQMFLAVITSLFTLEMTAETDSPSFHSVLNRDAESSSVPADNKL